MMGLQLFEGVPSIAGDAYADRIGHGLGGTRLEFAGLKGPVQGIRTGGLDRDHRRELVNQPQVPQVLKPFVDCGFSDYRKRELRQSRRLVDEGFLWHAAFFIIGIYLFDRR